MVERHILQECFAKPKKFLNFDRDGIEQGGRSTTVLSECQTWSWPTLPPEFTTLTSSERSVTMPRVPVGLFSCGTGDLCSVSPGMKAAAIVPLLRSAGPRNLRARTPKDNCVQPMLRFRVGCPGVIFKSPVPYFRLSRKQTFQGSHYCS